MDYALGGDAVGDYASVYIVTEDKGFADTAASSKSSADGRLCIKIQQQKRLHVKHSL